MAAYVKRCDANCGNRVWGGSYLTDLCGLGHIRVDESGQCREFIAPSEHLIDYAKWDPYKKYGVLSDIEEEIEPTGQLPLITKDYLWGGIEITGSWGFSPRVGCAGGKIEIRVFDRLHGTHSQITGWALERQHFGWEVPEDTQPRWAIEVLSNSEEVSGPEEAIAKARAWVQREIQKYK